MGIFTTREIAIFIYVVILIVYALVRKKGKSIMLPVIKAACHIKLIIPFLIVLLCAVAFVWMCTHLPFWNWIYVKDIVFWTLFAGVPVCFNAASRQLEEHYFRNILIDNLKFAALVEFITGTFTFHIILELILQPVLVIFVVLQSAAKEKSSAVKKFVDRLVGVVGLMIIALTIKSIIDSIGDIQFVDVTFSFVLPLVLSVLYLPVAYFFAVYAKYEILFMRMDFKAPKDKKLKRRRQIEVIRCCRLSYKKVCQFLHEYVQKTHINMTTVKFETIIDEFRGTTEHTYYAVIKHNGKYCVSRPLTPNTQFAINSFTINKGGLFSNSNKELRKEIALQIQSKTSFKNTIYSADRICGSVCLKKVFLFNKTTFFKRTKIAIFYSNEIEDSINTIDLFFAENLKKHCDSTTFKLMKILKWNTIGPAFIAALFYCISFILTPVKLKDIIVDLDVVAFVFAAINHLHVFLTANV